ncbi:sel1 repeat family protein [Salmonella enterica subsp. enterica serovar Texas]|nr:sel1 repeat family protein [Salmonella enterica subsp. enterica serovar Texas]
MTSTPDIFNLSERDKLNLEKKSKDGDSNASFRLYEYYAFTLNDNNRLMEYLRTAALQGSVIAQYNLGIILSDKDLEQAIYWMDMAAKNGNINARNKLQEFKKLNSYTE